MTIAVITIVAGRHAHLLNQQHGLARSNRRPDVYVVVAMGDRQAAEMTKAGPLSGTSCLVVTRLMDGGRHLPLAAARNLGAADAIAAGADRLVFLDVDCIPSATLLEAYARSLATVPEAALHCGVVRYLPALPTTTATGTYRDPSTVPSEPHPARPRPEADQLLRSSDWQLFWSLSFAVTDRTWRQLGGFHEEYAGYGAEDTDFGYGAHRGGVDLVWVGGADAYHQHHGSSSQSDGQLDDILRNATIFERRWGFWPMLGWLEDFQESGRAQYEPATNRWLRT